jgi:hypothetical protein
MPIVKRPDGWWWGSTHGPYDTKQQAVNVAQAAHASGFKEKREKNLTVALDYHDTYSADPKFWDTFIYMCWMRKWDVLCVTHATDKDELDDLYSSIGKVIGKKNVIETKGQAKLPYCEKHGIDIDIWIDNNPIHIIENPPKTE